MLVHVLEFREKLRNLYSKYDRYCRMAAKFIFALAGALILSGVGGSWSLSGGRGILLLAAALVCAFLPSGMISVVFAMFVLLQTFSFSLEAFLVAAVLLMLMILLYFSFRPHNSVWLGISLVLYLLRIPQLAYLLIGLLCLPYTLIPACFGVLTGYFMRFIANNLPIFAKSGASAFSVTTLVQVLSGIFGSQELYFQLAAAVLTVLVVYILRKCSFHYARYVAVIAGSMTYLLIRLLGMLLLRQTMMLWDEVLLTIVSAILVAVITLFIFVEDYSRVEYAQFEDDEYYYYVKAVPKMSVSVSETKVKKINAQVKSEELDETKSFTPVK